MATPAYFDYAATCPTLPEVLAEMLPYFGEQFGNPGSVHGWGQQADKAVRAARLSMAGVLNCRPDELIFTSGGSESDNMALRGVLWAARADKRGNHFITTAIEHPAVLETACSLAAEHGFELTILPVNETGQVTAEQVGAALRPDTVLVSVIWGNNEIGSLNPIAEIGALCRQRGVLLHTDAVQAAGQLEPDVSALQVDLMSLGAHKFYGPKGVGALFVRQGVPLQTNQTGGSQERNRRAGTLNVPLIVGMAAALRFSAEQRAARSLHAKLMRNRLITGVLSSVPDSQLTGHPTERLPNHASFALKNVDGNDLLMHLDLAGIAASSGSACKTGNPEPSEVLEALGLGAEWTMGSLRLTVGVPTTESEIEQALAVVPTVIANVRTPLGV